MADHPIVFGWFKREGTIQLDPRKDDDSGNGQDGRSNNGTNKGGKSGGRHDKGKGGSNESKNRDDPSRKMNNFMDDNGTAKGGDGNIKPPSPFVPNPSSPAAGAEASVPTPSATGSLTASTNHRSTTILVTLSGVFGFLIICIGLWLFCGGRYRSARKRRSGNRDAELQDDGVGMDQLATAKWAEEASMSKFEYLPPLAKPFPVESATSTVSTTKRKLFRAVSMGGLTSRTGTTSRTNFVIALPPPPLPVHSRQSNQSVLVPSLGYYDPSTQLGPPTPSTPDDELRAAGVRNAESLFSRNNSSIASANLASTSLP